jgi:branched-subunit amino acid transport protein
MIEPGYFWNNIFILALGTIAIRGSIIALSTKIKISERWKEVFSFIPASILPAFVAPAVFFHKGQVDWIFGKERFLALMLATVVCYFSKSTLTTIGFGLAALYLLSQS